MNLQKLRDNIVEGFNLAELRKLCFDLNIQYEELAGTTLSEKTIELVEFCKRHGRLTEFVAQCQKRRPNISWQEITETIEQWPPHLRKDKLSFLCWVYIKSNGMIFPPAPSDDIANVMKLTQLDTIRVAQHLTETSLIEFVSWTIGIKITHQGIVKTENDILEGFLMDDFPIDIVDKIKERQQIRWDYLRCLYRKSQPASFQPVSSIEIANDLGSNHYQLESQGILHYLNAEGWLRFRGVPSIQITETGIEKVEAEN